jgi:hypothetical protein
MLPPGFLGSASAGSSKGLDRYVCIPSLQHTAIDREGGENIPGRLREALSGAPDDGVRPSLNVESPPLPLPVSGKHIEHLAFLLQE